MKLFLNCFLRWSTYIWSYSWYYTTVDTENSRVYSHRWRLHAKSYCHVLVTRAAERSSYGNEISAWLHEWALIVLPCVSAAFAMAYHAGIPEDPNVLVQNISSNIQRITVLSNADTLSLAALLLRLQPLFWITELRLWCLFLPSCSASELQRAVFLLGTDQDSNQLRQTLWVI